MQADQLLAVEPDRAGLGPQQAEDALQQHRLSGAGPADDDQRFAGSDGKIDSGQHPLRAEGLAHSLQQQLFGHEPNTSTVMTRLSERMRTKAVTTASVVARPTPAAPPFDLKP